MKNKKLDTDLTLVVESFTGMIKELDVTKVLKEEDIQNISTKLTTVLEEKFVDGYNTGIDFFKKSFETNLDKHKKEINDKLVMAIESIKTETNTKIHKLIECTKDLKDAFEIRKKKLNDQYKVKLEETKNEILDSVTNEDTIEALNKLVNTYIAEAIPERDIIIEEENKRLRQFYDLVKDSVMVTNEEIQMVIKEEQKSTKKKISEMELKFESQQKQLNEKIEKLNKTLSLEVESKIKMTEKMNQLRCESLVFNKTKDLPDYQRRQVELYVGKNKGNYKFLTENVDKLIKKVQGDVPRKIVEESSSKQAAVIEEQPKPMSEMDMYANIVNKLKRKK